MVSCCGEDSSSLLEDAVAHVKSRVGSIYVEGRYHRLPKRVEDDYLLDKAGEEVELGIGSHGTVFSGRCRHMATKVALKTLDLSNATMEQRAQVARETEIFLSMDHPHVVRLMDVYESEDTVTFVMELMDGGQLRDRLMERKVFAETDAAHAAWQMLLALTYLCSRGVAHRDLKLANFLYDREGSECLKLIDFGLSRFFQHGTSMTESVGTLGYVAPEVLSRRYEDGMCDMWSFGVIVFVLLAGYMPFTGASDKDTMHAIRSGRYLMNAHRWRGISQLGRDFVQKLLVVQPQKRLTAEKALEHRWILDFAQAGQQATVEIDGTLVEAFRSFAESSQLRQACLLMMAWCVPQYQCEDMRSIFNELDRSHKGVINVIDLKDMLEQKCGVPPAECTVLLEVLASLGVNQNGEIHYSGMQAVMLSTKSDIHDSLVRESFRRLDVKGWCGSCDLWHRLGEPLGEDAIADSVAKGDDHNISVDYLRNPCVGFNMYASFESATTGTSCDTSSIFSTSTTPSPKLSDDGGRDLAFTVWAP